MQTTRADCERWLVQGAFICTILIFLVLFVTYTWDYVRSYWDLIERHAPAGAQQAPAAAPAAAPAPAQNIVQPHQPQQPIPQAQAELPREAQTPEAFPSLSYSHVQDQVKAQGEAPQEAHAPRAPPGSSSLDLQGHIQAQDETPQKDPALEVPPSTAAQGHTQPPSANGPEQASSSSAHHEASPRSALEAHIKALPSTQGNAQGSSNTGQPEFTGASPSAAAPQAAVVGPQSGPSPPATSPDNDSMITGESVSAATKAAANSHPGAISSASEEMTPEVHDNRQAAIGGTQPSAAHEDLLLKPISQTDGLAGPSSRAAAAIQHHAAQPAGSLMQDAPEAPTSPARDADGVTAQDADIPPDHDAATSMEGEPLPTPAQGTDAAGEAGPAADPEGAAGQAAAAQAAQGMVIDAAGLDADGAAPGPAAGAAAAGNAGPAPGEELQVCS